MKHLIFSSIIALGSHMPVCAFESSVKSAALTTQQAYLKASDTSAGSNLGRSVAISGNTAVVGAYGESNNKGAVYVFVRNGGGWTQQQKLTASNGEAYDQFGISVAIVGETIVVGALYEDSGSDGVNSDQADNNASSAGAAYVFTRSGAIWSQQAYLKASNSEAYNYFGTSVAIAGETIVVGAYGKDSGIDGFNGDDPSGTGAAYVFTRSGVAWSQQAYLTASNSGRGDYFGSSVAISGETIVIGAYGEKSGSDGVNGDLNDNSAYSTGAAYVFTRSGNAWAQQAYLKASNSESEDYFGLSVAIAEETIVVGAVYESSGSNGIDGDQADDSEYQAGAAYVFTRNRGAWIQQAYLKAGDSDRGDYFGVSVAITGETIVVGASGEDSDSDGVYGNQADNSESDAGAAYVFTRSGVTWAQRTYLKASSSDEDDYFGVSVAIAGGTIVVGAPGESSITSGDNRAYEAGAAYIFSYPTALQFAVKVKTKSKLGKVTGAGSFNQGSSVTLTAKPKKGKKFLGWYEGKKLLSKKKKLTLTNLAKNRNLIAKFK